MPARPDIADLDGTAYDTVVIGGGINGASASQHLAAAGYKVLLVEKGDFGGGSTSRSTRLMHCGLRYFETPAPIRDFALAPGKLLTALRMARASMEMRGELATDSAPRLRPFTMLFPLHRDGAYRGWHLDVAFRVLGRYGPRDVPLNYRRVPADKARDLPFVAEMRDPDRLSSVASFTEYLFDWPERLCMDAVLDAQRLGAVARNGTAATAMARENGRWAVPLEDTATGGTARARAPCVLNMAGIWIDRVNAAARPKTRRLIFGTKGVHLAVRLPPAFRDHGIATVNSLGEPHYVVPSQGGLHHIGPTETVFEGDPDDIRPEAAERDFLLEETRHALPGLKIGPDDLVYAWAGVRPLGNDPAFPKGKRSADVHDLGADGMPGVFALTGGPVMTHRTAGRRLVEAVAGVIRPSGPARAPDYTPHRPHEETNAPPFLDDGRLKLSDLVHAVTEEQATSLWHVLVARTGAFYHARLTGDDIRRAAEAVSAHLGWDADRIEREVAETKARFARLYEVA